MRYGSLCSGIEAATVAWDPLGWTPAWFSEIAPFPCAVLAHHYPTVPNLGDMTQITEADLAARGAIDVLVGGTPCQSFSVAGLRKGLADPRGNLALEFLRILDRTRARWMVWENVPGVLSSAGGRDFGAFLGGLGELGYGWSYRVLDAQYFGLAQRRRRVFVVGHLGDWRRAAAVLLERASLRGDPAPSREAGAGVAGYLDGGAHGGGFDDNDARAGKCVTHSLRADGFDASEDGTGRGTPLVAAPLTANYGKQPDNSDATPPNLVAYQCHGSNVGPMGTVRAGNGNETGGVPFLAAPLTAGGHPNSNAPGRRKEDDVNLVAFHLTQDPISGDLSPCLSKGSAAGAASVGVCVPSTVGPLRTNNRNNSDGATEAKMHVPTRAGVRRLTPRECERLQGFPDDYTFVPHRGKPSADGPRYRALGNSMAVPVMRWIGRRIAAVDAIPATGAAT